MHNTPAKIFISYAHHDAEWLDRIHVHLKPLARDGLIQIWDDRRIGVGSDWREEIAHALANAEFAIVLVSPHFLASDFIATDELPPILKKAQSAGTIVIPVVLRHCLFQRSPLSNYQSLNAPERPLSAMSAHEIDEALLRLAIQIMDRMNTTVAPNAPYEPTQSTEKSQLQQEIASLVATIQGQSRSLASCVSEALGIAVKLGDIPMRDLCESELAGYPTGTGNQITFVKDKESVSHRIVDFIASIDQEINIDAFPDGRAAIRWLRQHGENCVATRLVYPRPIGEIERAASSAGAKALLSLRAPASSFVPGTNLPDATIFLYADGESLQGIVDRVRAKLTTMLLQSMR